MILAESPARVEADPARDQPPHAPPTPNRSLRSSWFLNRAHKPRSSREETSGSAAALRAQGRVPEHEHSSARGTLCLYASSCIAWEFCWVYEFVVGNQAAYSCSQNES